MSHYVLTQSVIQSTLLTHEQLPALYYIWQKGKEERGEGEGGGMVSGHSTREWECTITGWNIH